MNGVVADELPSPKNAAQIVQFESHVLPLLQKAGCSQLACHGAFQGQGEFRLSLNGRSPNDDFVEVSESGRIDRGDPKNSRLIQKALGREDHGGGQRFNEGSIEYRTLLSWLSRGAPRGPKLEAVQLVAKPDSFIFDENHRLQSITVFRLETDGASEVTDFCTLESLTAGICTISDEGIVEAGESFGEGQVLVRYGRFSTVVSVLRSLRTNPAASESRSPQSTSIDKIIADRARKVGVQTSEQCSDEEFIRRVTLDLTGTLPDKEAMVQFRSDQAPNKREHYVETLLNSEAYADYWASWIARLSGCDEATLRDSSQVWIGISALDQARLWQAWVRKRIAADTPYKDLVTGLLTAVDREPDMTWSSYLKRQRDLREQKPVPASSIELYADRTTNPLYWAPNRFVGGKAGEFAEQFLGRGYRCAQCHDHPYEMISQADYRRLNGLFTETAYIHPKSERTTSVLAFAVLLGLFGFTVWRCLRRNNDSSWFHRVISWMLSAVFGLILFVVLSYQHLLPLGTSPLSPGLLLENAMEKVGYRSLITAALLCCLAWLSASYASGFHQMWRPNSRISTTLVSIVSFVFFALTLFDYRQLSLQPNDGRQRNNLANVARIQIFDWLGFPGSELLELASTPSMKSRIISVPDIGELRVAAGIDPRKELALRLTEGETPQLARSLVNRIWFRLTGAAFVEPVESFSNENPPVLPEVLNSLTRDFVVNNWSIRKLLKQIVLTDVYQRKAGEVPTGVVGRYWNSFVPRALNELQLVRSIQFVTGSSSAMSELQSSQLNRVGLDRLSTTCEGRLLRAGSQDPLRIPMELSLLLQNHNDLRSMIVAKGSRVDGWVSDKAPDDERITDLFQQAYCRLPNEPEIETIRSYVATRMAAAEADERQVWGDVVWAVINSEEFLTVR